MPRPIITSSWSESAKPTTSWWRPREDTPITTSYDTPRKKLLLKLENWLNFELENGEFILTEWGIKSNIITTNWN